MIFAAMLAINMVNQDQDELAGSGDSEGNEDDDDEFDKRMREKVMRKQNAAKERARDKSNDDKAKDMVVWCSIGLVLSDLPGLFFLSIVGHWKVQARSRRLRGLACT